MLCPGCVASSTDDAKMGLDYAGTRSHNLLFHIFVDEYIDHHHQCPDQTVHKAAPPTVTSLALMHHPSHAMVVGAISVPLLLAGPTGPTGATGNATVAFGFVPATTVGCTGVVGHSNLTQVLLCLFYVYFMFISIHNFSVLFLTILIVAIL